jgi:hypothetical protein
MNGDPVAAGLGVNIRVYDDRVSYKSGKRVIGQQIRRENSTECRHVSERAVDFERDHDTETGCDVPQPIWVMESYSWQRGLGDNLVKF